MSNPSTKGTAAIPAGCAAPDACTGMDDIRAGIDALDRQLVPLLALRLQYVGAAAAFKPTEAEVVVPWRIEAIVEKVRGLAAAEGISPDLMEELYRTLIDRHIAHEGRVWRGEEDIAGHPAPSSEKKAG